MRLWGIDRDAGLLAVDRGRYGIGGLDEECTGCIECD